MKLKRFFLFAVIAVFSFSAAAEDLTKYTHVKPKVVTGRTGVKSLAGNADDPAVWIHPTDPSKSLIFGVDKSEGTWVWTLDGKELTHFDNWGKPGNIEVRYGFDLAGKKVDIVALNLRKVKYKGGSKMACYAVNPDYTSGEDLLTTLCDGRSEGNDLQKNSYGFTLYKDSVTGKIYCFEAPDDKPFNIRQYLLESNAAGTGVTVKPVRDLEYSGLVVEGMVADDELGFFYVSEETEEGQGVYKYLASPDASPKAVAVIAPLSDGYRRDREGLALYDAGNGKGYLLVVDQGASPETYSILRLYDRVSNKLVKTVVHLNEEGDFLWDDDGVDANSSPLPGFPNGIVVGHDGGKSTFVLYDWADFAGSDLLSAGK